MIGQDGLQYAGAFKLSECKLITHTGPEVDLTQVITEVNIYEELQSHSLSADITFFDDKDAEIEKLLSEYTADLHKIGLGVTSQNIFIVSDQSINAFVTAQGNIYINTGLIYHSDRPNEVKSIIAHEIGQILNNHHITRMIEYENFQKKQSIFSVQLNQCLKMSW